MPEFDSSYAVADYWRPLPWQQEAWSRLQRLREAGALPHAMLLSGPEGVGKAAFAVALARQLLCASPSAEGACGQCHSCALSTAGTHPDWYQLQPDGRAERIRIDAVRALCQALAGKAQMVGHKVAVLQPAERLNANAANALLKTLEEPAAGTFLLLVSDRPRLLPATVRSRCQLVGFGLPAQAQLRSWMQTQDLGAAFEASLRLSGGRPMQALRWIKDGTAEQLIDWYRAVDGWRSGQVTLSTFGQACEALPWELLVRELVALLVEVLRREGIQMALAHRQGIFRLLDELHRYRVEAQRGVALNHRLLLAGLLPRLQRALGAAAFSPNSGSATLSQSSVGGQP